MILLRIHHATATSFADQKDVEAYRHALAQGKTELEALAVGDNGVGCWGDVTAQEHTAYAALHRDDLVDRWGSVDAARHKGIKVQLRGRQIRAVIGDRCGVRGRVDLNPACLVQLGVKPGLKEAVAWYWEEDVSV